MLKAALVDVGGTLWPDRWEPEAEALYVERLTNRFAFTHLQIEGLLSELEARDPALASPLPLTQDSHAMAAESLAAAGLHHVDPGELLQIMDLPATGVIEPLSGVREFLMRLRSLKLRTVIFSNATFRTSAGYRRDFDDLSVGALIDDVISSVDLGYRKPSPEMFDAGLRAAACSPHECVVVGDSEEKDIRPACGLGMRTVLVAIEGPPPETSSADTVATSLHQAAESIGDWTPSP